MQISILRLGHRLPRDERITTHVCLVARAFGASEIFYSGQHDESLETSVSGIVKAWGGNFTITYEKTYLKLIKRYKEDGFAIVHLTMYGMPLPEKTNAIKNADKLLVIVGAEKVEREVYELADFNISITSQPHSEVAALAITLDRIVEGNELTREFDKNFKGEIKLEPNPLGKTINKTKQ
ncbi:MAG: tRNA (cytidine(56)-2'-O)-methyltransferase [Candidatus Micrarchaeota archaeon]